MATNYTTKTASLKATTADIRKLTVTSVDADELKIDGVDIMESIQGAADAATAAAGIHVGTETSMVKGGENGNLNVDADEDGNLDAGVPQKVKGMNFCGNVAVVNNADGTVDFWFMNPDNHSKPSIATESGAPSGEMYVYDGTVNTDGLTKNSQHSRCIVETSNATLTYTLAGTGKKDGSETSTMAADNKISTIKVYVTDGDGTELATVESPAICEANTATQARGGTITHTEKGVTITLTGVTENKVDTANNINDAQLGYTPGYVRFSGKVQVATSTVLPDGGTCKVKVVFKSGSTETKLIESGIVYAYVANALTADDKPAATLSYNVTSTKTISGLTYDSVAKIRVDATGIKGTQRGGAHSKAQTARAYTGDVTEAYKSGTTQKTYVASLAGDLTTSLEDGTATNDTAIFGGHREASCTNEGDPDKVVIQTGATVQSYEQGGGKSSTAKVVTNTVSATTWLQTSAASVASGSNATTSNSVGLTIKSFTDDDKRVLAAVSDKTFPASHATYASATSLLEGEYAKQLLVQGTSLRYPTTDVTGTYASATGWRSYAVPVSFGDGKTIFTVTTTGSGTWANDKIRLFIVGVKDGVAKAQCLSWAKGDSAACLSTTGAIGVSTGTATSSGSWSVATDPGGNGFPISNTDGYTYYIVVQMNEECKVKLTSLKFA